MTLSIMQPYLFPYIGYWQLIYASDRFVIYDDVNYIKQGFINRNYILSNNQKQLFTLQLIGASSNKLINEIKVGNNQKKLLKTIKQNYMKTPFFNDIYPLIEEILLYKESNLALFIGNSIKKIVDFLEIDTDIIYSSNIKKNNSLKAQSKVIDICKILEAKVYINPIGGQKLYDKNTFTNNNIELKFLKPKNILYTQFNNKFVENLSIIDIMMFNDKKTIQKFLREYELI